MNQEALKIINDRFGKDTVIALGTINGDYPAVRFVNAYYEEGAFYVITYALSDKMRQIAKNPNISVCAEWFTARGKGENLDISGRRRIRKSPVNFARCLHHGLTTDTTILRTRIPSY